MQMFHLGIDVAKAKLDCALRLPDGKLRSKVVENSFKGFKVLTEWLEKHGATAVHVCMEATGVYWEAAAEYLAAQGMAVSVVNPAQIIRRVPDGAHQDRQGRCPVDCWILL